MTDEKIPMAKAAFWVSIASAFFALLSGAAATFQAWDTHRQLSMQYGVNVSFAINTQVPKRRVGIGVENAGPGVARIKSVAYYVDGKRTDDIESELDKLGIDHDEGETLDASDVLGPGTSRWLIDYPVKNREELERFARLVDTRIRIAIEYCSATRDCERKCSTENACPE